MNGRIRELARQATGAGTLYMLEDEYLKFAKLIVQECAGLLEREAESNHDEGTDSYRLLLKESKWIKRYFGVEE